MKTKSQLLFALLIAVIAMLIFSSSSLKAQNAETLSGTSSETGNSLYVVLQRSDMCSMMADNFCRWNSELVKYYSGRPSIVFLSYDITDARTIESTKTDVERYGLLNLLNANMQPGRVFLIDPNHQMIINMVDMSLSTAELRNSIDEAAPLENEAEAGF